MKEIIKHLTKKWEVSIMENEHRKEIGRRFPKQYLQKRIISLNIPDNYFYGEKSLIKILEEKMKELFEPLIE